MPDVKRIRCGMGLGDSLYLQGVVRHLLEKGHKLEPCSDWPDVFRYLPVKVVPFTRQGVDIVAHYSMRKGARDTDQFEDCCINARISEPVDFRLDWKPVNAALVEQVKSHGKPVILVQLPRNPMNRKDGFGAQLLPNCAAIQTAIDAIGDRAFKVLVGSGKALYSFTGIDLDLSNRTSVTDLIDLGWACDGLLGYVSFFVPLAESLKKPALFVWSRRGLSAAHLYIRQITPQKILHRDSSAYVFDDSARDKIETAATSLYLAARGR